jgi:alkylhydroperoxidase family enzyme
MEGSIMAWIQVIPFEKATGLLKKEYNAARKRAGRIWRIVSVMSLNPRALKASMDFYSAIMHGRSPLSRSQREMLAVVVSAVNGCIY